MSDLSQETGQLLDLPVDEAATLQALAERARDLPGKAPIAGISNTLAFSHS